MACTLTTVGFIVMFIGAGAGYKVKGWKGILMGGAIGLIAMIIGLFGVGC